MGCGTTEGSTGNPSLLGYRVGLVLAPAAPTTEKYHLSCHNRLVLGVVLCEYTYVTLYLKVGMALKVGLVGFRRRVHSERLIRGSVQRANVLFEASKTGQIWKTGKQMARPALFKDPTTPFTNQSTIIV